MLLDTTTAVATPERVRFRHRIAGPGRRGVAWAIDSMVQLAVLLGTLLLAGALGVVGLEGFGIGQLMLVVFFLQWFYGAFFESLLSGRTPGKWVMKLRSVTDSGAPATPRQFVLRNLLKGADFLPAGYGVGVLVMTLDARLRRVGDLVAGTIVVDERMGRMLDQVPIKPPVSEAERRAMPARVELTREEVVAIEDLLRRRSRLSDERAEELAAFLAPQLRATFGFDCESDERTLVLAYARATGRDRSLEAT